MRSPVYSAIFLRAAKWVSEKQPLPSIGDFWIDNPGASFSFIFPDVRQALVVVSGSRQTEVCPTGLFQLETACDQVCLVADPAQAIAQAGET